MKEYENITTKLLWKAGTKVKFKPAKSLSGNKGQVKYCESKILAILKKPLIVVGIYSARTPYAVVKVDNLSAEYIVDLRDLVREA